MATDQRNAGKVESMEKNQEGSVRRNGQSGYRKRAALPEGRVPPHSVDMEQALLGSCILEGGNETLTLCVQEKITKECFYKEAHSIIFSTMLDLYNRQQPIDEMILIDELKRVGLLSDAGDTSYILEISDRIDTAAHLPFYIERVRDAHLLRELIAASQETLEGAFEGTGDISSFIDRCEQRFFAISQGRITDSAQPLEQSVDSAIQLINRMVQNRGQITGAPTGFVDLDRMTTGFHGGEMIVVAARPSMGKTSLALNLAEAAICPKGDMAAVPTLMFSLEMPSEQLAMRLLCSRARVNMRKLRDGFLPAEKNRDLVATAKELKAAPLDIDDSSGLNIREMRAKARRWANRIGKERERAKERNQPLPIVNGAIIVDYLQLVSGTDSKVPREQQISEISRGMKAIAKELSMPVIVLAQLNRESEKEKRQPRMSDLRESGSIEQDADVVLLLSKPKVYDEEEESASDVVARDLIVAKQRNGPVGTVPLMFTKHLTRFENYTPESL